MSLAYIYQNICYTFHVSITTLTVYVYRKAINYRLNIKYNGGNTSENYFIAMGYFITIT